MLITKIMLLCSKLCQHNVPRPKELPPKSTKDNLLHPFPSCRSENREKQLKIEQIRQSQSITELLYHEHKAEIDLWTFIVVYDVWHHLNLWGFKVVRLLYMISEHEWEISPYSVFYYSLPVKNSTIRHHGVFKENSGFLIAHFSMKCVILCDLINMPFCNIDLKFHKLHVMKTCDLVEC